MYNSRPRSYKGGFSVPENYSGNAFVDNEQKAENESIEIETGAENENEEKVQTNEDVLIKEKADAADTLEVGASPRNTPRFSLNASRLFRGGIGFEELLIIALILLISQSENNEDVIVLLALLLFVS